jgi:hypothetical protein
MAKARKVWNPKYNKVWVRTALQDVLTHDTMYELNISGKKLIKDVLAICDKRALEQEEELKKYENSKK